MLKTKEQIKSWLNEYGIIGYIINDDLSVNVDRSVNLVNRKLTEIPVQFNKVLGDFWGSYNKLTSLTGSPKEVHGNFWCDSNKLTNLKGSPKKVKGNFNCHNNELTSLKGAPKEVNGWFYCVNNSLNSLEYFPENCEELVCDKRLHNTKEYKVYIINKKLKEMV